MLLTALAVAATLALAGAAPHPNFAKTADISQSVRAEIGALGLKKASIAVSIRDVATGRVITSYHADEPMVPASNMKLLTTGAALMTLGPDFAFETRLLRDGDRLVLVGDGDPALGDPELLAQSSFVDPAGVVHPGMTIEHLLDSWVRAVAQSGVKSLSEVVVDDRIFAREGAHPAWPKDQLDEAYCSPPSGANFHGNALMVSAAPGSGGVPSITALSPKAPWLSIRNKGTSRTGKNDRNTAWIARAPSTGELTLFGNVKTPLASPIAVGLSDPALFFAQCLADRLTRAGIPVARTRTAATSDGAPSGTQVGPVLRTPIETIVARCNVESENLYAESLLKRIGAQSTQRPGSWESGSRAVERALTTAIGQGASAFRISDGSGLSKENRVTANGMTAWLTALGSDSAVAQMFVGSLAEAGKSGTVRKRMKEINPALAVVQCKTGYIDKVSCLSGFVTSANGTRYAFSILGNGLTERDSVGKLKRLQDRIAALIADSIGAPSRSALGG
ncbi:MAG: D-alanyl-D-alanine carboxypeptidase/D-alanyl-D-alanine-endopeptidase [Phycisphaerales bacterium]|nr:D-alanyl-D-alanine carboxypeptidase/D-alanyl-D-alanine-endopeptidase [Phycisphaerales bacterium]